MPAHAKSHVSIFCVQCYGLWDHEGPLEEQIPSPVGCEDEKKTRERDEDGRSKKGGREDMEKKEAQDGSRSLLEIAENSQRNQLEKVDANN